MRTNSHSVNFSVELMRIALTLNQTKTTSFSNCFEKLSLARQFVSVSSSGSILFEVLNTSNRDCSEENDPFDPEFVIFDVLNDEFLSGRSCLVA